MFYAPLTEGDLTDHISGTTPTSDVDCGYEWDATKGMYLLHASGSYRSCYTALKYSNLNMFESGHDHTLVIDVDEQNEYFTSSYTNRYNIMIGVPIIINSSRNYSYICHCRYNTTYSPIVGLHRYACVVSNGTWRYFQDGVLKNTMSTSSVSTGESVAICQLNTNNQKNYIWAKNARVYNRALSDGEVAQL